MDMVNFAPKNLERRKHYTWFEIWRMCESWLWQEGKEALPVCRQKGQEEQVHSEQCRSSVWPLHCPVGKGSEKPGSERRVRKPEGLVHQLLDLEFIIPWRLCITEEYSNQCYFSKYWGRMPKESFVILFWQLGKLCVVCLCSPDLMSFHSFGKGNWWNT